MKHYNFITEDVLKAKTHWSKSGQVNAINELVSKYPSPKQFKDAVKKNGDQKSIQLIQKLPDNASRNDYIDFLQTVFTKYSTLGKNMLSAAAGLGVGAATAYAAGRMAEPTSKEEFGNNYQNKDNSILTSVGRSTNRALMRTGDAIGKITNSQNGIGRKIFNAGAIGYDQNDQTGLFGGFGTLDNMVAANMNKIRGAQVLGGAAGMGVGTLGAHGIQSWRQKKLQSKIDALKNG